MFANGANNTYIVMNSTASNPLGSKLAGHTGANVWLMAVTPPTAE
jgi:hypothetical protein